MKVIQKAILEICTILGFVSLALFSVVVLLTLLPLSIVCKLSGGGSLVDNLRKYGMSVKAKF